MRTRCSECGFPIDPDQANRIPVRLSAGADPEYVAVDAAACRLDEVVCVRCSGLCPTCLRADSPHDDVDGRPDTCDSCHYDTQIAACEREMLAAVECGAHEHVVQQWVELRAWFEEKSRTRPAGRRFDAV